MAKKVLMATLVLLAFSMMISQGLARVCFSVGSGGGFRRIPPIVSTDWLDDNLDREILVILDVRSEGYDVGHIPGAINVPEAEWYILDPAPPFTDPLYMELPPDEDLFDLIGGAGITHASLVVVVGSTTGPFPPLNLYNTAGITRVAITLLYAGVKNVAILDGGYEKWVADGYTTEPGTVTPTPKNYMGAVESEMLADIDYVDKKIGKSIIVDARDSEVYSCIVPEPWNAKPGHIPTAKNLPTPSLWNIPTLPSDYITYKDMDTLKTMASDVIGEATGPIIVHCGVGGYASTMYFVLSEVLGYTDVKFYDGSSQEWTHADMPTICP